MSSILKLIRVPRWAGVGVCVLVVALIGMEFRSWFQTPTRNLIFISLDTTRADRLGCYGWKDASTPVLDGLASRGVLFERAYAPVPLTLPSHTTMFTGLYPPEHGVHNNGQASLPASLPTLATELQASGYDTAAFVAAFVLDKKFGLSRGFDHYNDDLSQADQSLHGHHRSREGRIVISSAMQWIERRKENPFFCWIHLFDPHFPYSSHPDRFKDQFASDPYDGELAYVDQEIGRLLKKLDEAELLESTTIVIVGDHGESLNDHGERAHGMTLYEPVLRVPLLIINAPGSTAGHRVAQPVSLVDLFPTLLESMQGRKDLQCSGRSLLPCLRGESLDPGNCYAETDEPFQTAHWAPQKALINSNVKYIRSPKPELYDLRADPGELNNLASISPDLLQEMDTQLMAMEHAMADRVTKAIELTDQERQTLNSLGYASPGSAPPTDTAGLRDVKDMLPWYNLLNDATEMMDAGRYDLAEPALRQIVAADDQYFLAHGDLGRCLLRLKKTDEAIMHLKRNVELDPGADRVRAMLGAALFLKGDYEAAVTELETTLRLNPELYETQYNLGLSLEKLQRNDEASKAYRECLRIVPYFTPAQQRLQEIKNR